MQSIKDLLKSYKGDIKGFADECADKLIAKGYILTKNFGWVLIKDIEKYSFLKKDKGLPTENKWNEKDGKYVQVIAQTYYDWQDDLKGRDKMNYAKELNKKYENK